MAIQLTLVLLLWPALALQAATTVTRIAVGGDDSRDYSLFLKSDGSLLWGMGRNSSDQHGAGSGSSLAPQKVAGGPWLRGTSFASRVYRLLSSTAAALPLNQWTPVWTNTILYRGPNNFSAPLHDDLLSKDPQRFYILRSR